MCPRMDINRPGGSLGRSQACNLALRLYGDEARDRRRARRPGSIGCSPATAGSASAASGPCRTNRTSSVAGYFYYYGHYYAALCIDELPADERPYFQDHLARILMPLQEKDGSWWDYPLYDYHQSWGTAMAVSALVRCRHDASDVGRSRVGHCRDAAAFGRAAPILGARRLDPVAGSARLSRPFSRASQPPQLCRL